ncbi:hypothetical protein FGG08_003098 [Glutinoglossum americanum]|uniref:DUF7580 domain-containing protein n=1 Tax=Glutinoglossum americanum TaxID=1670608 RepID=A0A9P8IBP7_9PEZI|nr:hypothetical protein FGG08_003098 [Glutinoglossum americanum]
MSGIEIAGLVLGSFPILLNCLDYYRKGFEPLEEWWNFRTHFIAFVDDIRHQMMRYNENMIRLLDPIIADNDDLNALVQDANDPRWTDGSLAIPLEQRLASECERFIRIIKRMEEVVGDLKRLLQIKDGNVHWIGSGEQRPWEWHLKRVQISFSKGKTRKVRTLATHNQELQEILGYSERIIPIADARKSSDPVALFEKIRQHACGVHNALKQHWKCPSGICRFHQAHLSLRAETKIVSLNVLFVLGSEQGPYSKSMKQEVIIQPAKDNTAALPATIPISYVRQATSFTTVQERIEDTKTAKKRLSFKRLFSGVSKSSSPAPSPASGSASELGKQARFATPTPAITISQHGQTPNSPSPTTGSSNLPPQRIADLCSSLRDCQNPSFGVIVDEFDRQFQLSKSLKPSPATTAPDTARLVPLPELLDAYHQASIDIARQRRFEMAAHIASALLQIQMSPWLSTRWSKHDFYFLADSHTLYSDHPYVSESFISGTTEPLALATDPPPPAVSEEDTRACIFTVGVIILELIFGHNIESCSFRHLYCGAGGKPNDQTDMSTARKWAQKVLGECGVEIADVVRRCLDCSFGPRPNFTDKRFREAVYEGVIRQLVDHLKTWDVVMP